MRSVWKNSVARIAGTAMMMMGVSHAASAADVWGLVIGIDDYQHVNKLEGAVNDAKDVAQALRKLGAKDVRLLLDRAASRDAVMAAWADLTAEAKPGDIIFLTYAGHGAMARDHHQFVVLPDFDVRGPGTNQRIFDAEWGQMLRAVPQLNVVFVVDSCHSGTMTRDYGRRRTFKVRAVDVPAIEDDKLAAKVRDLPAGQAEDVALPNVVHLGAVQPDELDPEIMIDDKPRGALSFAVARAVEGMADANHNGALEPQEVDGFVRGVIGMATDGQQHPTVVVRRDWAMPLKRDITEAPPPVPPFTPRPVRLAVVNAGAAGEAAAKGLTGIELVAPDAADLVWNVGKGEISSHLGDVVSYGANGGDAPADPTRAYKRAVPAGGGSDAQADLARVQKVVDKMALVTAIKAEATRHTLTMALVPDDRLHHAGTNVAFTVEGQTQPYLTLFNLASDGTVNFLYPLNDGKTKDPLQIPLDKPHRLDLTVQPPFGADHLVAIMSSQPLGDLHARLAGLDGSPSAARLGQVLAQGLAGKTYQIGIHPSFTAPN